VLAKPGKIGGLTLNIKMKSKTQNDYTKFINFNDDDFFFVKRAVLIYNNVSLT